MDISGCEQVGDFFSRGRFADKLVQDLRLALDADSMVLSCSVDCVDRQVFSDGHVNTSGRRKTGSRSRRRVNGWLSARKGGLLYRFQRHSLSSLDSSSCDEGIQSLRPGKPWVGLFQEPLSDTEVVAERKEAYARHRLMKNCRRRRSRAFDPWKTYDKAHGKWFRPSLVPTTSRHWLGRDVQTVLQPISNKSSRFRLKAWFSEPRLVLDHIPFAQAMNPCRSSKRIRRALPNAVLNTNNSSSRLTLLQIQPTLTTHVVRLGVKNLTMEPSTSRRTRKRRFEECGQHLPQRLAAMQIGDLTSFDSSNSSESRFRLTSAGSDSDTGVDEAHEADDELSEDEGGACLAIPVSQAGTGPAVGSGVTETSNSKHRSKYYFTSGQWRSPGSGAEVRGRPLAPRVGSRGLASHQLNMRLSRVADYLASTDELAACNNDYQETDMSSCTGYTNCCEDSSMGRTTPTCGGGGGLGGTCAMRPGVGAGILSYCSCDGAACQSCGCGGACFFACGGVAGLPGVLTGPTCPKRRKSSVKSPLKSSPMSFERASSQCLEFD